MPECRYAHCVRAVHGLDPHNTCIAHSPCWENHVFHPENCRKCKLLFLTNRSIWSVRLERMKNDPTTPQLTMLWASEEVYNLYSTPSLRARQRSAESPLE